ncbi:MAG: 6-carboxytetrahydropterin synthase QueD [Aminobacterium sp.]|jgi:6-pyruvoyltetrahydropterin/6-carboxytetrahydropterin synthase|uniref:6-carboxy-5,6,7,8-tetrahydropterin synthase n=1 Tax=bioreactor metagenome TaxID=1076179 RepID=A0A645DZ84_9ZZZZ|nr:6-carboxytetrahydropterin synthase QueD [Aminobacterium sp.]MDD2206164.1 6-carboxytetrahydropterin synthase QueD [Aminobacterium sp.]MDD3425459.1 6-carboxytetrahydropterin synthase QueD [Aminobacterium sp.]MDD3707063.1 6-carboxytetrahydropterin synthase QueD [Aminobacterium sp.]MDD4227992.1 6-carboxytetrahydropterin synthase QueD [Aminobacterium sp.]MDD4551161.1 6-carboxytetrahydropterin synthase QueD [Aminobacterium sp.]
MLLKKEFIFDAAHNLVHYKGKCENLHGHTYRMVIVIEGTPDHEGMVVDFCEVSSIVKEKVVSRLDHAYINDIIPQPSAENIAVWVWKEIEQFFKRPHCHLYAVEIWETATSGVIVRKEDIYA